MNRNLIISIVLSLALGIGTGFISAYVTYRPEISRLENSLGNIADDYQSLLGYYTQLQQRYSELANMRMNSTVVYHSNLLVPNVTEIENAASFVFPLNLKYNTVDMLLNYNVTEDNVVRYQITNWDVWKQGKPTEWIDGYLQGNSGTISLFTDLMNLATSDIPNYIIFFSASWKEDVRLDFKIDVVTSHSPK